LKRKELNDNANINVSTTEPVKEPAAKKRRTKSTENKPPKAKTPRAPKTPKDPNAPKATKGSRPRKAAATITVTESETEPFGTVAVHIQKAAKAPRAPKAARAPKAQKAPKVQKAKSQKKSKKSGPVFIPIDNNTPIKLHWNKTTTSDGGLKKTREVFAVVFITNRASNGRNQDNVNVKYGATMFSRDHSVQEQSWPKPSYNPDTGLVKPKFTKTGLMIQRKSPKHRSHYHTAWSRVLAMPKTGTIVVKTKQVPKDPNNAETESRITYDDFKNALRPLFLNGMCEWDNTKIDWTWISEIAQKQVHSTSSTNSTDAGSCSSSVSASDSACLANDADTCSVIVNGIDIMST
jgi:hypothetical protein